MIYHVPQKQLSQKQSLPFAQLENNQLANNQPKPLAPSKQTSHLSGEQRVLPVIESIATGTPQTVVSQREAAKFVANLPHLEQNRPRIERLYQNTRIDTRHLALNVMSDEAVALSQRSGTIQQRMQLFQTQAIPLAQRVASKAIASANQSHPTDIKDDIRMVVFVTSTGFVGPGVDAALIERLGLRRDTARTTVSFMGCAAAMNGLRVACDHVRAYPTHKVLVVCLELSSVNAAFEDSINDVIIHSIFGDGCAAVIVGGCEGATAAATGQLVIRDHLSYLVESTQDGITLGIRDNGITCQLSRHLPDYIEAGVGPIVETFLAEHETNLAEIDLWGVHPGGTRIIQKVQSSLGLSDAQVADSWAILRQYGNMLSASILFVLERMMNRIEMNRIERQPARPAMPTTGLAFSFSPGVGVEGILFEKY
ncbi:MAG: 3-oxoacyl-[acyl-carrier-protein] synthase III C-terminal domain-containing protein [Phormidesmis sp.]